MLKALTAIILLIPLAAFARPLSKAEQKVISDVVSRRLKDPFSAQFKFPDAPLLVNGTATSYCGLVNAKNSFGGYVGDTPFLVALIVRNGKVIAAVVPGEIGAPGSIDAQATAELCAREGLSPNP